MKPAFLLHRHFVLHILCMSYLAVVVAAAAVSIFSYYLSTDFVYIKFIRRDLKDLHNLYKYYISYRICRYAKCHKLCSNGPLITATKPKAKCRFHEANMLSFMFCKKFTVTNCVQFKMIYYHTSFHNSIFNGINIALPHKFVYSPCCYY